ncbi:MarR family transcriptional regulator [Nitrosopumilus sp. b3]|uniref:helix-turn-helix transcriptional regulator n=1 Tax=Nitrosopumilus sp. b3 TaxID=2109909 RepID=UPI0015F5398A|nr:MarR family transcriptional regulator [Nitrosopumilus sp. b3]KAF6248170.1 MarR family transcriptional regulator [Nitrosopumilus sp. b3]
MNPEIVPIHRKEFLREDGMLFVRTEGILETMVKAPLIIASLIVVALAMPIQTSFSSTRSLDITVYSDGSAHVSSQIEVDPLDPDFEVNLFGPSIDNFVAVGENGFLLSSEIIDNKVTIDTFGTSSITIDYDIHDLISKEGRVWTFTLNSPTDYSLLMPANSIIVGMTALPSNMVILNDQTQLELSTGLSEINYILGTANPPVTNPPVTNTESTIDIFTLSIVGISITAAVVGVIFMVKRNQTKSIPVIQNQITESQTKSNSNDPETIFKLRPEMREDDKEIIKFISENGGQVLESDLRKKFLQPRTTMWRAVKRLERQGVIEISKKDLQNLVKLKTELEEEE